MAFVNCKEILVTSTTSNVAEIQVRMGVNSRQDSYWHQALEDYGAALERLAWAYEADSDRRRDLLQEIHVELWRSFDGFDGRCSLRTWVYRVAHNVATTRVLRKKRNAPVFLTLEEIEARQAPQTIEESLDRRMALERLLSLVQQLELPDRQLMLAYLEGIDAESISEITGLSTANVWTRIHRIKKILIRQFHPGGASDGI